MTVPGDSPLPREAGWYPDPYDANQQRWFDGSKWTLHAVADSEWDPDHVVERNWATDSPEQLRRQEWDAQFPPRGTISYQTAQPSYDRKSGLFVNRPRPWLNAFSMLFSLVISGVVTVAVGLQISTSQYWGVWAVLCALFLGLTIWLAFRIIRDWPRAQRITGDSETTSRRFRAPGD